MPVVCSLDRHLLLSGSTKMGVGKFVRSSLRVAFGNDCVVAFPCFYADLTQSQARARMIVEPLFGIQFAGAFCLMSSLTRTSTPRWSCTCGLAYTGHAPVPFEVFVVRSWLLCLDASIFIGTLPSTTKMCLSGGVGWSLLTRCGFCVLSFVQYPSLPAEGDNLIR